jgi:hypothetical protein
MGGGGGSGMRWGRGPGGRAGGGAVTSGAALSRQRPESGENGQAWPSRCMSRGGGRGVPRLRSARARVGPKE